MVHLTSEQSLIHQKVQESEDCNCMLTVHSNASLQERPEQAPHYCGLRDHVHQPTDHVHTAFWTLNAHIMHMGVHRPHPLA